MIIPALDLPELLDHIPANLPANIARMRRDRRIRLLQGLYVMARTGISLAKELRMVMEANLFLAPGNRSVQRVFLEDLPQYGLAIKNTQILFRSIKVSLLRLSPLGYELCNLLGWMSITNEWEFLINAHNGDLFRTHTVGLLVFCFHVRLRNWQVELLPTVSKTIEPDVRLYKGSSASLYVEFEVSAHGKLEKWTKSYRFQGLVALCTFTLALRKQMVNECCRSRTSVIATDLQTLAKTAYSNTPGNLWQTYWINWHDNENNVLKWMK